MQKSITLIELLISFVLISVVLLAVFGIYNASSNFFTSSDTKSVVLNEMAYLLDHIDKNVFSSIGWIGNRAITVRPAAGGFQIDINQDLNPVPTPIDFNDDTTVTYYFDTRNNTVTFQGRLLTNKLIQDPEPTRNLRVSYNAADGILNIDNLCIQQDPDKAYDPKSNPNICITGQKFSTSMQSLK